MLTSRWIQSLSDYPQLGLIQLYDGEQLSLIDPLPITEWQPFRALLQDLNVVKYLHAGSEDLEVFLNAFDQMPTPMIDTQVLAAFSGRSLSCGFAMLVAEFEGVELDKIQTGLPGR